MRKKNRVFTILPRWQLNLFLLSSQGNQLDFLADVGICSLYNLFLFDPYDCLTYRKE